MFATILRRWRLMTPVALVVLAVAIVSGGMLDQVSAHGVKFHFFGWATALEDNSIIFPDHNCSTGPIDINGGSLDTGHCIPLFGGNSTSGFNNTLGVLVAAQFAEATVKTDNTKHEGHTISTADVEGLEIDAPSVNPALATVPGTTVTTICLTSAPPVGSVLAVAAAALATLGGTNPLTGATFPLCLTFAQLVAAAGESGESVTIVAPLITVACPDLTNPANDTATNLFLCGVIIPALEALPSPPGPGETDTDAGLTSATVLATLADILTANGITSIGGVSVTSTAEILEVSQIEATAEAECEQKHNHPNATARALTNDVFNDLVVQEGTTPVDSSGDPVTHVSPSGEANQSFPVTAFAGLAMQLTFNEQHSFQDGGFAWIKAEALHIIVTNAAGVVLLDLVVDHVVAGIHCAKHLPTDDSIGA